jgi:hypothetical protein
MGAPLQARRKLRSMPSLAALVLATTAASTATAAPAAAPSEQIAGEPAVERRIAEDSQNRIDEFKVRGETRRVVVRPKAEGVKEYEIAPPTGATDPSQGRRTSAGERVWRLFTF